MLYRNPDSSVTRSGPGPMGGLLLALLAARRRHRADLDLLALSDHMKRDLGLFDLPGGAWLREKQNAPAGPGRLPG